MSTLDPVRAAAIRSHAAAQEDAIGSLAEIQAQPTINLAARARNAAMAFHQTVQLALPGEQYAKFRGKVGDVQLTIENLSNSKISQPKETLDASLNTIHREMVMIATASKERPHPSLARLVATYDEMQNSGKAYASLEQKKRTESLAEKKPSLGQSALVRKLSASAALDSSHPMLPRLG